MQQHRIEKYFAKKGINVMFNTLGHDSDLIHSFVHDFKDDVSHSRFKKSQHVKLHCYTKMYTMEPRHKMTGFEKVKGIDNKFRNKVKPYIVESQFSPLLKIDNNELSKNTTSYKKLLKEKLSKIDNPLLYLSGGMDSELVALSMLDAEVKFTPVIFEWIDNTGKVVNNYELRFAYNLCSKHGLIPLIKQVNVEQLWDSDEFMKLAIELQLNSTHLTTYAHAINLMSSAFPNSTHMFGGEVRFDADYLNDNGDLANIVYLEKVVPAYDGLFYSSSTGFNSSSAVLVRYNDDGNFDIRDQSGGLYISGVWYSPGTPAAGAFEVRSTVTDSGQVNGNVITYPSYGTIGSGYFTIPAEVNCLGAGFEEANTAYGTFTIYVRKIGETTPVVAATVQLSATSLGI